MCDFLTFYFRFIQAKLQNIFCSVNMIKTHIFLGFCNFIYDLTG